MQQGTKASKKYNGISEREFILDKFSNNEYDALVAIKCLDEGVDIPSAQTAIILASSGNPREYIQRIGRVLRRHPGKEKAKLFDIIVLPRTHAKRREEINQMERKIVEKELRRYKEFSNNAMNSIDCLLKISVIEEEFKVFISKDDQYD